MKKNSKYVGVDEKFIPEDEKYVDDSLLGDKEKTKKVIGTGFLVYSVIFLVIFVAVFIMIFRFTGKKSKQAEDIIEQAGSVINQVGKQMENQSKQEEEITNQAGSFFGQVGKMMENSIDQQ